VTDETEMTAVAGDCPYFLDHTGSAACEQLK